MTIKIRRSLSVLSVFAALVIATGCDDNDSRQASYLDREEHRYYETEIVPPQYDQLYGMWKLERVEGGLAGIGRPPDFDYLEFKRIGIYAIIRADTLLEEGHIAVDTFDTKNPDIFQIVFKPASIRRKNSTFSATSGYVQFNDDGMYIGELCCDTYRRYFTKERRN